MQAEAASGFARRAQLVRFSRASAAAVASDGEWTLAAGLCGEFAVWRRALSVAMRVGEGGAVRLVISMSWLEVARDSSSYALAKGHTSSHPFRYFSAPSLDGRMAICTSSCEAGALCVWDTRSWQPTQQLLPPTRAGRFSPSCVALCDGLTGPLLACGAREGALAVWRSRGAAPFERCGPPLQADAGPIASLVLSGARVIAAYRQRKGSVDGELPRTPPLAVPPPPPPPAYPSPSHCHSVLPVASILRLTPHPANPSRVASFLHLQFGTLCSLCPLLRLPATLVSPSFAGVAFDGEQSIACWSLETFLPLWRVPQLTHPPLLAAVRIGSTLLLLHAASPSDAEWAALGLGSGEPHCPLVRWTCDEKGDGNAEKVEKKAKEKKAEATAEEEEPHEKPWEWGEWRGDGKGAWSRVLCWHAHPDGAAALLALGFAGGGVLCLEPPAAPPRAAVHSAADVAAVRLAGPLLLSACAAGVVRAWRCAAAALQPEWLLDVHPLQPAAIAIAGHALVCACADGNVAFSPLPPPADGNVACSPLSPPADGAVDFSPISAAPRCLAYAWLFDSGRGAMPLASRRAAFDGWARTAAYEAGVYALLQAPRYAIPNTTPPQHTSATPHTSPPQHLTTSVPSSTLTHLLQPQLSRPPLNTRPLSHSTTHLPSRTCLQGSHHEDQPPPPRHLSPPPAAETRLSPLPAARLWRGAVGRRLAAWAARRSVRAALAACRRREGDPLGARLPSVGLAQRSSVCRVKQLLTPAEIAEVVRLGARMAWHRPNPNGSRQTCYLNANHAFATQLPRVRHKLVEAARRVDRAEWGLLDGRAVRPRCVEYHRLSRGKDVLYATHHDFGSLVTIDVMLSASGDFDGGAFQTLEADGTMQRHVFGQGDAVVFISHKYHCVAPVERGERQVLVIELWEGDERACPHRCNERLGKCILGPQPSKLSGHQR
ncbi:hypothetical protein AB1Y20_004919 [Prymnesium parvum]|uniref:Fe2OG dioxygenase domain-containing protein n=1 Tax=Prymnesium parvum TaxID=97485 RepID=A0AB34IZK3_PRYPA